MRIGAKYSHLNGEEFLLVHHPDLWDEVKRVIAEVDASKALTKVSRERTMPGEPLYSPRDLNAAFKHGFVAQGWSERRRNFWVSASEEVTRRTIAMDAARQREEIESAGLEAIASYNQTDFVKRRVAVEVQFGKYSFVAFDIFVKHLNFYVSDVIDVAIEIVPMKELESQMSSGVPYYERDLTHLIRQGRGVPHVPLILLGVAP